VRHDFEAWAPKLSPRAVVLFHDTNMLERGFGVARFWAEVEGRFPSFSFLHGHGLGVLAAGPDVPPAVARLCATEAPSGVAILRERFATLGRVHGLDYALRETVRHEQRLRREAAERDEVVDSLRRSMDEVLRHRDSLLAAEAMTAERLAAQAAAIDSLRAALAEAQGSLAEVRDELPRLVAEAQERARQIEDRDRAIGDLRAQSEAERAELARLRTENEALRGHLMAARADAKAARADGRLAVARLQDEIEKRDTDIAALRAAADARLKIARAGFGMRAGRH
jgi:uncharacterized coiled-coil protein SlyX